MQGVAGTKASEAAANDTTAIHRKQVPERDGKDFRQSLEDRVKQEGLAEKGSKRSTAKDTGESAKDQAAKSTSTQGGSAATAPEPAIPTQELTGAAMQAQTIVAQPAIASTIAAAPEGQIGVGNLSVAAKRPAVVKEIRGNRPPQTSPAAQAPSAVEAKDVADPKIANSRQAVPVIPVAIATLKAASDQGTVTPVAPALANHSAGTRPSSREFTPATESSSRSAAAPGDAIHTLEAVPHALEVGVSAGVHGWLRVRAELATGGEVSAQVIAGSAGAAAGLHKELPALTAYLTDEKVGLTSLVITAAERSSGGADAAAGSGARNGGAGSEGESGRSDGKGWDGSEASGASEDAALALAGVSAGLTGRSGNGGWLSVLA